jgi:uncharacterized oxidoreductase
MNLACNTILITGGGSGIGRVLPHPSMPSGTKSSSLVVKSVLWKQTVEANPGMNWRTFDQNNTDVMRPFAAELMRQYRLKREPKFFWAMRTRTILNA